MEPEDLKKLLTAAPVESKLTPQQVMRYVESKRRGRQRVAAVAAALTLTVGVGAGAMMLNSMTSHPQPQILTTPSPAPSPKPTASQQVVSETLELREAGVWEPSDAVSQLPYPEYRCAVNVEDVWSELTDATFLIPDISLPLAGRGDARLVIQPRFDNSAIAALYWDDPTNTEVIPITQDAMAQERYAYSDGRFVAFADSQGQLQVWDSQFPSEPPRIVSSGDVSTSWVLTGGYLWLYEVPEDPASAESSTAVGNLDLIDLAGAGVRKRVISGKELWPFHGWGGMLQTSGLDDRGVVMIHPEGNIYTLSEGWSGDFMLGDYAGVQGYRAAIPGGSGGSLRSSAWPDESIELGSLTGFADGWAVDGEGNAFNYLTGVTVLMNSNDTHSYEFLTLDDGQAYVVATVNTAEGTRYRVELVSSLPKVSC